VERRLAIILAVDVVGYSRLMAEAEAKALGVIRDLKEIYLEPVVSQQGGEVLKRMGDGWIIAFSSISIAVQCAMEIQDKLVGDALIKLRMGAHIGEIVFEETDFHGASVNLAQRLETEAPPGGLMLSQDLYRQLNADLAKEFTDAGSIKLKNINLPMNGFQWRPKRRGAIPAGDVPSIAVDFFECAPDDPDTRAAVADLRDQLMVRLSGRTGIRVLDESTGRTEASDYLLRGRLRLTQTLGRFTLSLILRIEGRPVCSHSYQGDPSDILMFCDDLIERADADLRRQINAFDAERLELLTDEELSVSELRSRAANAFYKITMEGFDHALRLLDRALQLNPVDPMALAMRAEAILTMAAARFEDLSDEMQSKLCADLDQAVELLPRSDYVFYARGFYRVFAQTDVDGALKDVNRALALSPAYVNGYNLRGMVRLAGGEFEKAAQDFEKAIALSESDPYLPHLTYMQAVGLLCVGKPNRASELIGQAIELRPSLRTFHCLQAVCFRKMGNDEAAKESDMRALHLAKEPSILALRPPLPREHADLLSLLTNCSRGHDEQVP
jgi:class 3 adenylate cyclase/tetratricopeptide (TPR) repeat protein